MSILNQNGTYIGYSDSIKKTFKYCQNRFWWRQKLLHEFTRSSCIILFISKMQFMVAELTMFMTLEFLIPILKKYSIMMLLEVQTETKRILLQESKYPDQQVTKIMLKKFIKCQMKINQYTLACQQISIGHIKEMLAVKLFQN